MTRGTGHVVTVSTQAWSLNAELSGSGHPQPRVGPAPGYLPPAPSTGGGVMPHVCSPAGPGAGWGGPRLHPAQSSGSP